MLKAPISAKDFTADFTITLGTHRSGVSLLVALLAKENANVSPWSRQALENPRFSGGRQRKQRLISLLFLCWSSDLLQDELATLDAIYNRVRNRWDLKRVRLRLPHSCVCNFLTKPNWSTVEARLGSFFVASEPFVLTREGFPKIFSITRDDKFPHPETGIGLWLIANGTIETRDIELPDRLFNASAPEGVEHGGRFAFVIPK